MATGGPTGSFALYPLRFGLALIFGYTALEKLTDPAGQAAIVEYVGLPAPEATTVVLGALELVGAAALLLGVLTRTVAVGLSAFILSVILVLKVPGPFWQDGWGIDVAVLAGALALAINGPGRPTLWSMLGRPDADPEVLLYRRLAARFRQEEAA